MPPMGWFVQIQSGAPENAGVISTCLGHGQSELLNSGFVPFCLMQNITLILYGFLNPYFLLHGNNTQIRIRGCQV